MRAAAFAAALLLAACGGKVRDAAPEPDAGAEAGTGVAPEASTCESYTAPYIGFPYLHCLESSE